MAQVVSPPARRLRRPRWFDPRLGVGLTMVLLSMVLGARVVSAADRSVAVWSVRRDLPAGTVLRAEDLVVDRVRLFGGAGRYLSASTGAPAGYTLGRAVGRGELLPRQALVDPARAEPVRLVTVPVARLHAPQGLGRGQRVDVFATYGAKGQPTRTAVVLRAAPIAAVDDRAGSFGGAAELGVTLQVSPGDAVALVSAVQSAAIDLAEALPATNPGEVSTDPVLADPAGPAP